MAVFRGTKYLEDSEPAYRGVSKTTPVAVAPKPVVAAPVAAPVAPFNFAGLASLAAKPAAPPPPVAAPALVYKDAQYRGEPIQKFDSGVDYAAPLPVTPTVPAIQAAIAPPPPPPVAPAFKFDPAMLASLAAKYAPAAPATTQAIQAAIAPPPPPPVAAPAAPVAMPTIQDYLKQQEEAFKPVATGYTGNGLGMQTTYSTYDSAGDIAEYKRLYGDKANPWDIAVAETLGKEGWSGGSGLSGQRTYTPYTVQELQDKFLSEQAKLTPDAFAKIKASNRPAKDYDTYIANYDKKFQALPDNMKQRAGLQGELLNQAGAYGFKWDTTDVPAGHHTYNIAKILEKSNVKSVGDLEWRTVNGEDKLFNKATGAPVEMFKDRQKQLGWASQGPGLVNYMVEKDVNGNPVIIPQWKSNAPGGVLGTALKLAPIALAFVPGIGPALSAGAAGLNAVVQGGDIVDALKSAGTSYLGGQVGGMAGDAVKAATQSMAPGIGGALTGAATGGASAAATGALRGDLNIKNIATGALTGGAIGGISDLVSTYLPAKGELQDQIRSPGSTAAPVSGSTFVDNVLRNAAVRAPGTLMGGGDLQDILVGSVAGEAGKTAAGYLPDMGNPYLNALAGSFTQAGVGQGLTNFLGNQPSAPGMKDRDAMAVGPRDPAGYVPPSGAGDYAQAPAQAPAPAPAPVVAEEKSPDLMPMLLAMGLMGNEPAQQAPAQESVGPMNLADLSWLYSSQQQQKPQSVEELLKSLQGYA
tara:strand:+ start:15126 stop:17378 length:2253 start_codon:yes stop_codon:yes gene_type:complete